MLTNKRSKICPDFENRFILQIRAAVPIRKGEHISIMYSDPMWGTANRQQHLYETKFFRCRCPRCLDPTELNTEFSSLRCPSCSMEGNGYLIPIDPLDHSSSWECNACKKNEPASYVSAVIRSIGEELVRLERGSPEACQSFVKKHSQNLHPNHYYLMDVKLALSQMIGNAGAGQQQAATNAAGELHEMHERDIVQKQKLCMEILNVANKISPGRQEFFSLNHEFILFLRLISGISRLRGVVMYELQSTLSAYARRKYGNGEISVDHLRNILKVIFVHFV